MSESKPPIGPVLEHYGATYVPEGNRWRRIKCPFHEDRTASASVNTEAGKFRCFACDISGDAYDVVTWKEGFKDFPSAREGLERILGPGYGGVLNPTQGGRTRRGVFEGRTEPQRGQRTILSTRVRRKPLAGA